MDIGQTGAVGRISQRRRFNGVREGFAQLAQGVEGQLYRGVDQSQTASETDFGAAGAQGRSDSPKEQRKQSDALQAQR